MSKIPVHVEQEPLLGLYFECDDAEMLSKLMLELWGQHESVDYSINAQKSLDDLQHRTEKFGMQYLNLIKRVVNG